MQGGEAVQATADTAVAARDKAGDTYNAAAQKTGEAASLANQKVNHIHCNACQCQLWQTELFCYIRQCALLHVQGLTW